MVFLRQCNGVLSHHSFTSGGVGSYKHILVLLQILDSLLLKIVQSERVLKTEVCINKQIFKKIKNSLPRDYPNGITTL